MAMPASGGITIGGPNNDIIFVTVGSAVLDINTANVSLVQNIPNSVIVIGNQGVSGGLSFTLDPLLILESHI